MARLHSASHANRGATLARSSTRSEKMVCAILLQRNIAGLHRLPSGQHVHIRAESAMNAASTASERCKAGVCAIAWRFGRGRHTIVLGRRGKAMGELAHQTLASTSSWTARRHAP